MSAQTERVPLAGSKKRSLPRGVVRNEAPAGEFTVRVMVRPLATQPTPEVTGKVSPKDRKYLSREEHTKLYGANPDDLKKVADFAAKHGLKVVSSDAAQRAVVLSGTAAKFSEAFGVQLVTCVMGGREYRCRVNSIYIPAELNGIVTSVTGLDNRPFAKPHFRVSRQEVPKAATAAVAAGGGAGGAEPHTAAFPEGFTAPQVAALYDFPSKLDGSGQTIAILELGGGYRPEELAAYFKGLGVTMPNVSTASYEGDGSNSPQSDPLDPANADVEVMLDIQVAGAVAPGAKILVYFAPDASDQSFLAGMSAIVHDTTNSPTVVSISWGGPESSATTQFLNEFDRILQSAAQLGMTVCVASGDDGSADFASDDPNWDGNAHVDFPASDPYVLACGGTQVTAADGKISNEVTWNEGPNDGSGGGVSRFFALPSYQQNAGVPAAVSPAGPVMRGVPDVAGNAAEATGYRVLCDGQQFPDPAKGIPPVGGTSAVAPLWAGLIACINQSLGKPIGFVNPLLYGIAPAAGAFHDITEGNAGVYAAKAGWDPCTGLGSPDGQKLLQAL